MEWQGGSGIALAGFDKLSPNEDRSQFLALRLRSP